MEQLPRSSSCWMWSRRRQAAGLTASYDESWEEQAFAEDTAGSLGGCVWPPRSYSCSFCRREFRSAQALGGHMNVHRRDRARLKQQSPPNYSQNHLQSDPLFDSFHHKVSSFMDRNPNPNSDHATFPEKNLLRTLSPSSPSNSSPKSCSSSDLGKETTDHHHHDRIIRKRCRTADDDDDDDDEGVSLNLFVRRARPASPGADEARNCKRKKTIENWALPTTLLLKPIAISSPSTTIDHGLDLELRLGSRYSLIN